MYVDTQGDTLTTHYVLTMIDGSKQVLTFVNDAHVETTTMYRNIGGKKYNFFSDVAYDFTSGNEPQAGYPEKNVPINREKVFTLSLTKNTDGTMSMNFDDVKLESNKESEFTEKVDNSHWMDGWPAVTFTGNGDLDFGEKRKYSTITDVTDVIAIIKLIVSVKMPTKSSYQIKPDLKGALKLEGKASKGANLSSGTPIHTDSVPCGFCEKLVPKSEAGDHCLKCK